MRAAMLIAFLMSAPAAFAERACKTDCHTQTQKCRTSCVHNTKTSQDLLSCRNDCVRDDDACRCDCGEDSYCEGGSKGLRGCQAPVVASRDAAVRRFVALLARK